MLLKPLDTFKNNNNKNFFFFYVCNRFLQFCILFITSVDWYYVNRLVQVGTYIYVKFVSSYEVKMLGDKVYRNSIKYSQHS